MVAQKSQKILPHRPRKSTAILCVALWLLLQMLATIGFAEPSLPLLSDEKKPTVLMSDDPAFGAGELAVIINDADPLSIEIGNYYRTVRKIPDANIVHVRIDASNPVMEPGEFAVIKKLIDSRLPDSIQAYALAWTAPYRVGCMSITSAFALGYDYRYCATGCRTTKSTSYFSSKSRAPWQEHHIRPAMMLAGKNFADVKAMIDRGVQADGSFPNGKAYLLETSDRIRSVRRMFYPLIEETLGDRISVDIVAGDSIKNKNDVMFYFTGLVDVSDLRSNFYLPGAVADHLTSYGGKLTDSSQMSSLRWLEAGLTGSYGTVVEPCAFPNKFPNPLIMMENYLAGERLIEAYWKSVDMPGQGVFIGEPLARPWYGYRLTRDENNFWHLYMPLLAPGYYSIEAAPTEKGPFVTIARNLALSPVSREFVLPTSVNKVWRVVPAFK